MLAPGSDRIPVELFQILKDDAVESVALNMQYAMCTQYANMPAPGILESITTNKASGSDGIPVELTQILKDDAVKVLHSICQQMW